MGEAEAALERNGMTGAQLLKLAGQAANTYAKKHPSFPASRIEDLTMHCVEQVCRRVGEYDPRRNIGFDQDRNPTSTPFKSWVWYVTQFACQDYVRSRREGFAGRIGRDKPVYVIPTDQSETFESMVHDIDEWTQIKVDHRWTVRYRDAAQRSGLTLQQWVVRALEDAAELVGCGTPPPSPKTPSKVAA